VVIITHDLGVVAHMADEIAVMYAGRIVEHASTLDLFKAPEHPYTWGLLGSIPTLGPEREERLVPISGRPPSLINLPGGCSFHPRCPYVQPDHMTIDPALEPLPDNPRHKVACLLEHETRVKLWKELREGTAPVDARADVMHDVAAEGSAVQAAGDTGAREPTAVEEDTGA
jgi:peptide/nickel transport system ATP-binding protein